MKKLDTDKVIVPIDFSEQSFDALKLALDLVSDPSYVHVIHVLFELSAGEPAMVWGMLQEADRVWNVKQAIMEKIDEDLHKKIHIEVAFGDPGSQIASYAEKIAANLIVLPSHGRTGLKRLFIGSVAERVVRLAHCPVLVLRS